MAWVATAVIGSAVSGVIGGIASNSAANKAEKSSKRATDAASKSAAEELAFEKTKYTDDKEYSDSRRAVIDPLTDRTNARWESIYGPLASNLGHFYNSLTSETFAAAGLTELAKSFSDSRVNVMRTLAQRGLGGGALEASLLAEGELTNAEAKATIRNNAPMQVAQAQSAFMTSLGNPVIPNAPGAPSSAGVSSAINNVGNAAATGFTNQAAIASGQARSLMQSSTSLLSSGINAYINKQQTIPAAKPWVDPGAMWKNPDTGQYQ